MKRRGSRVQTTLSVWNRTQPVFSQEITRGGAMRNLLFLTFTPLLTAHPKLQLLLGGAQPVQGSAFLTLRLLIITSLRHG